MIPVGDLEGEIGDDAEDVVVAHPEALDEIVDKPLRRDLPDLVAELLLLHPVQQAIGRQERLLPHVDVHFVEKLVDAERLRDEIDGPRLHGRDGQADGGVSGDHDDRDQGVDLPDPAQQIHAVHARHLDVADDQVVEIGPQRFEGFLPVGSLGGDVVALLPQGLDDQVAYGGVVIDDEDGPLIGTIRGHDPEFAPCGLRIVHSDHSDSPTHGFGLIARTGGKGVVAALVGDADRPHAGSNQTHREHVTGGLRPPSERSPAQRIAKASIWIYCLSG